MLPVKAMASGLDIQSPYYHKIKNLVEEWKIYSEEDNALVPYIESINARTSNIHLLLSPEIYKNNGLFLKCNSNFTVFLNNKLIYNTKGHRQIVFSIDSLAEIYGQSDFLISVYTPDGIKDLETSIVSYSDKNPTLMESLDHLFIFKRDNGPIWDFMRLGILILLILYVVLINIDIRVFSDYYNIIHSFVRSTADEFTNRTRNISRLDLVYVVVLSAVLSFLIVVATDQFPSDPVPVVSHSTGHLFVSWLWILFVMIAWILLRFLIISLSSDLFKMRSVGTIHTFEYLRITNFYGLSVFLMMVILLFIFPVDPGIFSYIIFYSAILISVLRAFLLYLKFLKSTDYTKLYLFSYLCIAELLPVIIGLKILLSSNLLHPGV